MGLRVQSAHILFILSTVGWFLLKLHSTARLETENDEFSD